MSKLEKANFQLFNSMAYLYSLISEGEEWTVNCEQSVLQLDD
jgi:hypothetical protein